MYFFYAKTLPPSTRSPFVTCKIHHAAIYDCFLFFNELELLSLRLHELDPVVDKFVLVESVETFTGKEKPLYFLENRDLFQKFAHKIIHVVLEERIETDTAWDRDHFQRNQILRGLTQCQDDDLILISDLDEIPSAAYFSYFLEPLIADQIPMVSLVQRMYQFYLNRDVGDWVGTTVAKYRFLKHNSPQFMRDHRGDLAINGGITEFKMGGWHFTWMGGIDRYIAKIESFAHQESNTPENHSEQRLENERTLGTFVPFDERFPQYLRDNLDTYRAVGFIR